MLRCICFVNIFSMKFLCLFFLLYISIISTALNLTEYLGFMPVNIPFRCVIEIIFLDFLSCGFLRIFKGNTVHLCIKEIPVLNGITQ